MKSSLVFVKEVLSFSSTDLDASFSSTMVSKPKSLGLGSARRDAISSFQWFRNQSLPN